MLKLRRNINQTLHEGAPPSCESPRILPLAPCVPPEDVPPTRIHRTARDGAHSVKPMAHPGALRGGCATPPGVEAATSRGSERRRKRETCEPVFFSREREHDRRNNRCYGPLRIHSPYTTPFGSSPYTRPQFRTEFGTGSGTQFVGDRRGGTAVSGD
jgi:hypothetical protein